MYPKPISFFTFALICASLSHAAFGDVVTDLATSSGDLIIVENYYGTGGVLTNATDSSYANTSYLVIDWNDASTPVAYGYRWNDINTSGQQMFEDIVLGTLNQPDDEVLFAKRQTFSFGQLVLGIGYNTDQDLAWGDLDDGTSQADFLAGDGILESTQSDDLILSTDLGDSYKEGDQSFTRAWAYFESADNPYMDASTWALASVGFSDRVLANNSWDGWAFANDASTFGSEPPSLPAVYSVPEPSSWLLLIGLCAGVVSRRRKVPCGT